MVVTPFSHIDMLAVDLSIMHRENTPSLLKSSIILSPTESRSSSWNVGGTGKELALGKELAPALITALLLILAGDVETNPGPASNGIYLIVFGVGIVSSAFMSFIAYCKDRGFQVCSFILEEESD